MTGPEPRTQIARARARADLARLRFASSVRGARQRLAPARIKEDALVAASDRVEAARADARRTLMRHPLVAASSIAGLVAILFWKPARMVALYGLRGAQLAWLNRKLWQK